MTADLEVSAARLRWTCDPAALPFDTTEQLQPLAAPLGQDRAAESLAFGLDIAVSGFNVFVSGPAGTGRTAAVRHEVERLAQARPTPGDWCYVHNFADPSRPVAIPLPAGKAAEFAEGMRKLANQARRDLSRARRWQAQRLAGALYSIGLRSPMAPSQG